MAKTDAPTLQFVDAPPKQTRASGGGRSSHWPEFLAPLQDNPGQWAQVSGPHPMTETKSGNQTTRANSVAQQIRNGPGSLDPDQWEVKTGRPEEDPENYYVYVRYIEGLPEQEEILAKRRARARSNGADE